MHNRNNTKIMKTKMSSNQRKLTMDVTMYVSIAIYLGLWLYAFSLWNRLSNIQPMTILQNVVSLIYILFFVWIIRCPRTLWMILGAFYIIIAIRYIYSAWFYKKTVEGFEMASSSKKPLSLGDKTVSKNATSTATPTTPATAPATPAAPIPITKENMEGNAIVEVDEWSEEEKRKVEGNPVRGLSDITNKKGKVQTEEDKEKQRAGITFTSAATAQQETYKLIDAVQQLQEVMTNLSPTLREGKKIMDMFEKFQIKK